MGRLGYAAMLLAVAVGSWPLHAIFGLGLTRQWRRVALAILPAAAVFIVWDVLVTRAGHWTFDEAQTLGPRLLGLPVEEWVFFVVIPLAGLLTWSAVGRVLHAGGIGAAIRRRREQP